ncbi:MAG: site-2 protease family protein [Candidatus Odinarchaeia archaeon]
MSLLGAVFLHEIAHLISLRRKGIETSLPYFIPGIPIIGLPTFGAIILQKSPPVNRDSLFDLGISGPLTSFFISLIVLIIGVLLSKEISIEYAEYLMEKYPGIGNLPVPLLFILVENLIHPATSNVLYTHPIAYAGWLGLLITALNLFPIGQLDGGHAIRAILDNKKANYASIVATVVLFALGYWLMAILVILLGAFRNQTPLDDASPLTLSRKIIWVISMVLLILSVTPFLIFI